MKRREFVKTMTAAGAGLLLANCAPRLLEAEQPTPDPTVRKVLVMFKCHFDAGFIDTQTAVLHKYFTQYFPQAVEVARAANADGRRRYVWTTGSWLLYEYLEQASAADRKVMEEAIRRGDVAWHALPFTWQTELLSPSMIEGSLAISKALDQRYGAVTTGAKMTDVPGHTRGMIAPLARHGVGLLEIGVNGGSTVAQLPPLFLWKDPSGASLPVMYHGDYGGIARVPGSDVALVTCVRDDNSGPHTAEEITATYADLKARFPNAEITAATLSEMASAITPHRGSLPVVTQEMGDTWIHGVASDPLKIAQFREIQRLRESWIAAGSLKAGDGTDLALLRRLLLAPEHTWGADTKTWLDFDNLTPADLGRMLETKNYKVVQFSWAEKRQDLLDAVATLPATMRNQATLAIQGLKAVEPAAAPGAEHPAGKLIETNHYLLGIDPKTGAMTRLRNKATGREWAGAANPVGLFAYQTLSKEDYDRFIAAYITTTADWAFKDFGKPNIERFGAVSQIWEPESASVRVSALKDTTRIVIQPKFEDEQAFQSGRAAFPRKAFIELLLPQAEPVIHLSLSWFEKPATRMPEALWLSFNPIAPVAAGWTLDKCGEPVSSLDVAASGNRHMHALGKGFAYREGAHRFEVETVDAPVVALGERTPLGFSNTQPDLSKGVHSSLFNNAWGTNYLMWFGEDMSFRFVLRA